MKETVREMLKNWTATEAKVRATNPAATDEAVYQIVKAAFNKSLSIG